MIKYKLQKQVINVEGQSYNTYSILCYRNGKLLTKIFDAFADETHAKRFVNMCNTNKLDPIHLQNVLDDYL